jgi:hypothetical protein
MMHNNERCDVHQQLDDVLAPNGQMLMVTVAENDPQGSWPECQWRHVTN